MHSSSPVARTVKVVWADDLNEWVPAAADAALEKLMLNADTASHVV